MSTHIPPSVSAALADLVGAALAKAAGSEQAGGITDFHVQTCAPTGEVRLCDDTDSVLAQTALAGCEESGPAAFGDLVGRGLKRVLPELDRRGAFDGPGLFRPFSFVLEDDEREAVEELYVVDDETVVVPDELLKGLDSDLDDFLKKLMEG